MSEKEMTELKFGFFELFRLQSPYTRQRYWGVLVCSLLANFVLSFIAGSLVVVSPAFILLAILFSMVFTWIYIAMTLKRLRDAGLSLYWTLLGLVPVVSFLTMVLYGCLPSAEPKNTKRARGVISVALIVFLAFPVLAVAAYLVYNNATELEQQQSHLAPAAVSVPQSVDSSVEEREEVKE